jgi:hypothetical protein
MDPHTTPPKDKKEVIKTLFKYNHINYSGVSFQLFIMFGFGFIHEILKHTIHGFVAVNKGCNVITELE